MISKKTQQAPVFILCFTILFMTGSCAGEADKPAKQEAPDKEISKVERIDPAIDALISMDAKAEVIAEGFDWSEGPLWVEEHQMLLFSDIPKNTVYKWTADKGKEVYLTPSGYTSSKKRGGETGSNGLLRNSKGQLVLCQDGDRRMAYMNAPIDQPKPEFISIADNYQGKKFDSPNDAVYSNNGDLFFTDPPYGLEHYISDTLKEAPYQGVYKVNTEGKVTLLTDSITRPNGIGIFPDQKSIIVANSDPDKAIWYLYDLDANNVFSNARIFYDATVTGKTDKGSPDGLKIDHNGNVFATGPGGIWVFDKAAKVLGKIRIEGAVSNCAFGDNDKTLYITADDRVLRMKLR